VSTTEAEQSHTILMLVRFHSWRRMRRASHGALTKAAVQRYHSIQTKEANILVTSLLTNPEDRRQHFTRVGASTVMAILYDYQTVASVHDKAIEDIERNIQFLTEATRIGSSLVEFFPWMLHIPQRYPHSPLFRTVFTRLGL
jgi:cytochrome P450